jgi:RNA-directed DNA polymerase
MDNPSKVESSLDCWKRRRGTYPPGVKPCVWTERMLAALASGVKGGKWHTLNDKVRRPENLLDAWKQVRANHGSKGVDGQTVEYFGRYESRELGKLRTELENGRYTPQAVRRVMIPKPGSREKRPLGIPTVRDRVVQTALRNVIEPIFEHSFHENSFGFRPGRNQKQALRRVDGLLREGATWIVDADLKGYFDTIPHDKLMERVGEKISDSGILRLIRSYLKAGIMDNLREWTPEEGTPQGAIISPLLANIYLDPLDKLMAERGFEMTRYADDFVVQCRSEEEARQALETISQWTESQGLKLHPVKTRIVNQLEQDFEFLGYRFHGKHRYPRDKSMKKFRERVRQLTRRTSGKSFGEIVKSLNTVLRGWYEYFKQSHRTLFKDVDGWIRHRLRSILIRRCDKISRYRLWRDDSRRWPISFFRANGLFSLTEAFLQEYQSLKRATR